MAAEVMFQEAVKAAQEGQFARARDLLTRLLRSNQNNPDYWLWMSAVVETPQEQAYCLKNLLKVDPENAAARRGLVMIGEMPPEEGLQPVPPRRLSPITVEDLETIRKKGLAGVLARPLVRVAVYSFASLVVIGLVWLGIVGIRRGAAPPIPTPNFRLTATLIVASTLTPEPTLTPTRTPIIRTPTSTAGRPTPLWMLLEATHTPTPMYVNTPHPEAEAYRAGLRAHQRGDWEAVADFMGQAIVILPNAADAFYYLGEAHFRLGEYAGALKAFEDGIAVNEAFGPNYLGRARARLALDPEADVSQDFADARTFEPAFGDIYLAEAAYLIQRGDAEAALAGLAIAESLLPDSAQLPLLRAQAYLLLDLFPEARDAATRALALDLTQVPAYLALAKAQLGLGEITEAIRQLETYILYAPEDLGSRISLAMAYQQAGSFENALTLFDEILQANPKFPDVYYFRGIAYLGMGEAQKALDDLNQANRLHRNSFEINLALGQALFALEYEGDAYIQYNQTFPLARTGEEKARLYYHRALSLEALNEPSAAARDWQALLDLPPEVVSLEMAVTAREHLAALEAPTPTRTPATTSTPAATTRP